MEKSLQVHNSFIHLWLRQLFLLVFIHLLLLRVFSIPGVFMLMKCVSILSGILPSFVGACQNVIFLSFQCVIMYLFHLL